MSGGPRSGWHKLAMLCLWVGFPVLVVGLGYPGWVEYTEAGVDYQAGLWQVCVNKMRTCTPYTPETLDAEWLDSVRGLEVLSTVLYIVTLALALKQCCSSEPYQHEQLQQQQQQQPLQHEAQKSQGGIALMLLTFLTGILSFTGAMVYRSFIGIGLFITLSISFWLTVFSACASVSVCILLAVDRRPQGETVVHPAVLHVRPGGLTVVNQQPSKIGYSHGQVITQALSPAYAPTYPGKSKSTQSYTGGVDHLVQHLTLPGQPASRGIGSWPSGNQGVQSSPGHRPVASLLQS